MTYTPPSKNFLKNRTGTDSSVISEEFVKIGTELDTLAAFDAAGLNVAKVTVAGGVENAIAFAWQNPEASQIIVSKCILNITTQGATALAVMDIGPCASATSTSDTLLDGVAVTATGLFDNVTNKGTNGLPQVLVDANGGTNDYITGKILSAAAAALVGKVYIFYTVV